MFMLMLVGVGANAGAQAVVRCAARSTAFSRLCRTPCTRNAVDLASRRCSADGSNREKGNSERKVTASLQWGAGARNGSQRTDTPLATVQLPLSAPAINYTHWPFLCTLHQKCGWRRLKVQFFFVAMRCLVDNSEVVVLTLRVRVLTLKLC
eukprot:1031595-Rhodomonas_salina.1